MPAKFCCASLVIGLLLSSNASAVILYSTPERNTDPPGTLTNRDTSYGTAGSEDQRRLLNSGWQYQGDFRGFLGTPIGPRYFVTAKHIGGEFDATNSFDYNGTTYSITTAGNYFDDPNSDLRIWRINETFSTWAPLYTSADEIGKPLVVIGRGTQRGAEVRVNGVLKGWEWGVQDGVRSWGENEVSGFLDSVTSGDQRLIYFEFNAGGGPNESILSIQDSGGGVFIQSGGVWKLAGISFSVVGPWHQDDNGSPGPQFNAAIFDAGGLWVGESSPTFITDQQEDIAAFSAATRISTEMAWIQPILNSSSLASVPEPGSAALLLLGSIVALRRRARD